MFTDAGMKGAVPAAKLGIILGLRKIFFLLVAVPTADGDKCVRPAHKANIQ